MGKRLGNYSRTTPHRSHLDWRFFTFISGLPLKWGGITLNTTIWDLKMLTFIDGEPLKAGLLLRGPTVTINKVNRQNRSSRAVQTFFQNLILISGSWEMSFCNRRVGVKTHITIFQFLNAFFLSFNTSIFCVFKTVKKVIRLQRWIDFFPCWLLL